jgi:hypothetical protein
MEDGPAGGVDDFKLIKHELAMEKTSICGPPTVLVAGMDKGKILTG